MESWQVARLLTEIADLMEIAGEDSGKAMAYRRAARSISSSLIPVEVLAQNGELRSLPGVGPALEKKIREILDTGTCAQLERLTSAVPLTLLDMLAIPELGAKTVRNIYHHTGIDDIAGLEEAARKGILRKVPGIGVKREQKILAGIRRLDLASEGVPLAIARPLALGLLEDLRFLPYVEKAALGGALRRFVETVDQVDILATSSEPERLMDFLTHHKLVREVESRGSRACSVVTTLSVRVRLEVVAREQFGVALLYSTGSRGHLAALEERARSRGLVLGPHGLEGDGASLGAREEDIYEALGLPLIPPEMREGRGEVAAAADGSLPTVLRLGHLKGDLHVHSDWSDGIAGLEELARAAMDRGYEYLGICDHSRSLAIAGGLSVERLRRRNAAIDELNASYGSFRLLKGIEVDILKDGSLDYPDEVLRELDVVIASIHSGFRQSKEEITSRLVAAARNPHVDIIGHPTGRLIGRRGGYEADIDELVAVAADTGTALEINASPDRLDLGPEYVRKAREAGVMLSINTDAHSAEGLADAVYGISVARRAWLSPEGVVNTRPLDELPLRRLR